MSGKVEFDYRREQADRAARAANVSSRERNRIEREMLLTKLRILRWVNVVLWSTIGLLAFAWVCWK